MKFTTLIPVRYNDGKRVPKSQLTNFMREFAEQFGGCSNEGITKGQWIDPADATYYHDECVRVSVVCERVMLDEARAAVIRTDKSSSREPCILKCAITTACRSWKCLLRGN